MTVEARPSRDSLPVQPTQSEGYDKGEEPVLGQPMTAHDLLLLIDKKVCSEEAIAERAEILGHYQV